MLEGNQIKLVNGKTIKVTPLDARRLYLDTSNIAFLTRTTNSENNHIESVSFEDKFKIEIGDKFNIEVGDLTTIYEVKYIIIEDKGTSVILFSAVPTKTSIFLLPVLGKSRVSLKYNSYFVNAYLDPSYEYLNLLYRFTGTESYKEFEQIIMTDNLCVSHMEHDPYHVVYKMKIPDKFKNDIELFSEGKYSKFSKVLTERIQKFYGKDSDPLMDVIKKSVHLKNKMEELLGLTLPDNSELASKPDMEIEIYKK